MQNLFQRRTNNKRRLDRLYKEQAGKCYYCQCQMTNTGQTAATVDHRKPLHARDEAG